MAEKTKKPKIYQVATAHLDTVWNWTLYQTVKWFLPRTFNINLDFMDKYPDYRFNFEGAYRYSLIKEFYPEAFERIKVRVADGHWMLTGSSWENGDVVTPEPESLMRNILYGNLFFEEQFGKTTNDVYLPDCFGFPWTLPTVMTHMGLKAFSSQKLNWNPEPWTAPFHVGRWRGIDGSEVIASVKPGSYASRVRTDPAADEALHDAVAALPLSRTMRYYGTGDDGGAPEESSVQRVNDAVSEDGINEIVSAYAGQLADELTEDEKKQLPVHDGDFLMVKHGVGGYTSVTPAKRFHRSNEMKADAAEKLAVMTEWIGAKDYPRERMRKLWCDFLRHEFHDDLPGTSIATVYRETFNDDIIVNNGFDGEIEAGIRALAANVDTSPVGKDRALVVFNPVMGERRDVVRVKVPVPGKNEGGYVVADAEGNVLPTQVETTDGENVTLLFPAVLPSVGYATYRLTRSALPSGSGELTVSETGLENGRYRVRLNENGDVASIYDKKNKKELLSAPITYQFIRNEHLEYGSWEIGYEDEVREPYAVLGGPAEVTVTEKGPVRAALSVTRSYRATKVTVTLSLDAVGGPLRMDHRIVWNETATLLKCAFPLDLSAENARFDRGLGSVECPDRTEAFYEVPVHKWANMYDAAADYSATIVNDCKYGMDKCGNVLRLTCIHTPISRCLVPTRQDLQDFGLNVFSVGISGDRGDFVAAGAELQGIGFNQAPIAALTDAHTGVLPGVYSFVQGTGCLSLKALKKAEKGDEYVIRVAESTGQKQPSVTLCVGDGIESVAALNGFERPAADPSLTLKNGKLQFAIGAYEPKTFAIKLKKQVENTVKTSYYPQNIPCTVPFTSGDDRRGAYGFGPDKTTVPRPLLQKDLRVSDVPLTLCENGGQFCALVPGGNELSVPSGADTLYLMVTRQGEDAPYTVLIDGAPVTFVLQSLSDLIGGWDQFVLRHRGIIREARVAFSASHTHDTSGDRVYGRFTWYLVAVDLPLGARTVVLPQDGDVLVAAATFARTPIRTQFVSDIALHKEPPREHRLTVKGGNGSGTYFTDAPMHVVYTGDFAEKVIWKTDTGLTYEGHEVHFAMPDSDLTLTAQPVGRTACALPMKGHAIASSNYSADTRADRILDGKPDTLWLAGREGGSSIVADVGYKTEISHMKLIHAEIALGEPARNATDFAVSYWKDGAWVPLFSVKNNEACETVHSFAPIVTQFVRVEITDPSRNVDDRRAGLTGLALYTDAAGPENFGTESVGPFDAVTQDEKDEILFHGTVRPGQEISFAAPVRITSRFVTGADRLTLSLSDAEGKVILTDTGAAARLLSFPGAVTSCRVESVDGGSTGTVLTLCGIATDLHYVKAVSGAVYPGSANPGTVRRDDGTMFLPAGEGEGHDLWGCNIRMPLGDFTYGVRLRIPPDVLPTLADDTPLFCFHPYFTLCRYEPKGKIVTVRDYKAALSDARGYRLLTETFNNLDDQDMEGRIWSFRKVPMEVAEFLFLSANT